MKQLSLNQWSADGYPGPPPGAIVLTSRAGHWLNAAITMAEALRHGAMQHWGHAMRWTGGGRVLSQDATFTERPMADYVGSRLRFWWDEKRAAPDHAAVLEQAELRLEGLSLYDAPGTLAQLLRALPWVGDWLAQRLDLPNLNFCSEGVCEDERAVAPWFGGPQHSLAAWLLAGRPCPPGCQISPADIDAWCRAAGWRRWTVKLTP